MNILFAFLISMCDKSRNTWFCVHWQWTHNQLFPLYKCVTVVLTRSFLGNHKCIASHYMIGVNPCNTNVNFLLRSWCSAGLINYHLPLDYSTWRKYAHGLRLLCFVVVIEWWISVMSFMWYCTGIGSINLIVSVPGKLAWRQDKYLTNA